MTMNRSDKLDWEDIAWNHNFKGDDKAMLTYFHHTKSLSQEKIGTLLNVAASTIGKRLKLLNILIIKPLRNYPSSNPRLPGNK